jgi:hypothetical protein
VNKIQAAKDSLYVALRDRLEQINPSRIAEIAGATRIAIAVESTLLDQADRNLPEIFYLSFSSVEAIPQAAPPGKILIKIGCVVRYSVEITEQHEAKLAQMDGELMQAMLPQWADVADYTGATPVALGCRAFWSMPKSSEKNGIKTAEFALFVTQ